MVPSYAEGLRRSDSFTPSLAGAPRPRAAPPARSRFSLARVSLRSSVTLIAIVFTFACRAAQPQETPSASAVPQGTGGINRMDQRGKRTLLLVSFDGFRADYLDRFTLPHFKRVLERGTRARALRPVFPSTTFPNHYSLVTGLYPEHHGIVENSFFDPARNATYSFRNIQTVDDPAWYGGEPIWVTAERQGMVAACFFWPGSEAPIKGIRATYWNRYNGAVPNAKRVETVLEWLRLPDEQRPHVVTLYFSDVDAASHRGPLDGAEVAAAIRNVDEALGQLLDGLEQLDLRRNLYLLLTSDHGMVETTAGQTVQLDSLIDTRGIRASFSGPITGLHVEGGAAGATRVRDALNAKLTHGRAFLRRDMAPEHHFRDNSRIGDVVVIMDEGWTMATSVFTRAIIQRRWGEHGWDPAVASMRAMFVIAGPGIPAGATIPEVDNVDVYPLMTELLGLTPAAPIDGQFGTIRGLLQMITNK